MPAPKRSRSSGDHFKRADVVDALHRSSLNMRRGRSGGNASFKKIETILQELQRYPEVDIGCLKEMADRQRSFNVRLATFFFVIGALALYSSGLLFGSISAVGVVGLLIAPLALWMAHHFHDRMIAAGELRHELERCGVALYESRRSRRTA